MAESHALQRYYSFHSKIYDMSRWVFLFGRKSIVCDIAKVKKQPNRILEVGCGTGYVLEQLATQFKDSEIFGIDLSKDMLNIAKKKLRRFRNVSLIESKLDHTTDIGKFDVIVFSYSLSMISEQWNSLKSPVEALLSPDGVIAVVDFHESPVPLFKNWMNVNHVTMDGHLPDWLENRYETIQDKAVSCYGNLWKYRKWIGKKNDPT